MNATSPTILPKSFETLQYFCQDQEMACHLAVILRLFLSLFSQFEFSHFLDHLLSKHIDTEYLVNATTTILPMSFLKLCRCFLPRFEDVHDI